MTLWLYAPLCLFVLPTHGVFRLPLEWSTPLVPLSFAYAIVRHRVIPISLIIRRGVRYLLVSRGSILLALLFVGLIRSGCMTQLPRLLAPP